MSGSAIRHTFCQDGGLRLRLTRHTDGFLHLRQKPNLPKPFKLILPVQSSCKKFSILPVGQIISTSPRRLVSQEGRLAIVTDAGRDAVDAKRR
jgi:hypothetical protein